MPWSNREHSFSSLHHCTSKPGSPCAWLQHSSPTQSSHCRKLSVRKETQREAHRMLVMGCLCGMQVTYKRLQTLSNQGRKHLWGSLRSHRELNPFDILQLTAFLNEILDELLTEMISTSFILFLCYQYYNWSN